MRKILLIALLLAACATPKPEPKGGKAQLDGYVRPQTAEGTLYYHEEIRDGMKFGIWIYCDRSDDVSMQIVNLTKDSLNCAR